jgi:hypothetical protein
MIRSNSPIGLVAATTLKRDVHDNHALLLDLSAGFTVTMPKATGSGARYRFFVKTSSNAYVISASAAGATFVGGYIQNDTGDTSAATADFLATAAGNNTYSPTTVGGGGTAGDWVELVDVYTNVYAFTGINGLALDPTNRFSTV